ncbi:hypothetical protein OIU77_021026 [Salix suchowensis]|uniref:Uncharacterized protein n=1 Tax=Salix suchowensis TaxID=1278906 RepID=A0ABQ9C8F6_9ROSI|nr:hypothetical protein OIU77_021026 [Salix suchowensis]
MRFGVKQLMITSMQLNFSSRELILFKDLLLSSTLPEPLGRQMIPAAGQAFFHARRFASFYAFFAATFDIGRNFTGCEHHHHHHHHREDAGCPRTFCLHCRISHHRNIIISSSLGHLH